MFTKIIPVDLMRVLLRVTISKCIYYIRLRAFSSISKMFSINFLHRNKSAHLMADLDNNVDVVGNCFDITAWIGCTDTGCFDNPAVYLLDWSVLNVNCARFGDGNTEGNPHRKFDWESWNAGEECHQNNYRRWINLSPWVHYYPSAGYILSSIFLLNTGEFFLLILSFLLSF